MDKVAVTTSLVQQTYEECIAYLRACGRNPESKLWAAARTVVRARHDSVGWDERLKAAIGELEAIVGRPAE